MINNICVKCGGKGFTRVGQFNTLEVCTTCEGSGQRRSLITRMVDACGGIWGFIVVIILIAVLSAFVIQPALHLAFD